MEQTYYQPPYALHADGTCSYLPAQVCMPSASQPQHPEQHAGAPGCSCACAASACASCDGMACWRCLNFAQSESMASCISGAGSAAAALCACLAGGQ